MFTITTIAVNFFSSCYGLAGSPKDQAHGYSCHGLTGSGLRGVPNENQQQRKQKQLELIPAVCSMFWNLCFRKKIQNTDSQTFISVNFV